MISVKKEMAISLHAEVQLAPYSVVICSASKEGSVSDVAAAIIPAGNALTDFPFPLAAMKTLAGFVAAAILGSGTHAFAQGSGEPARATYEGNVFRPAKVEASDARVASLRAPGGFAVTKYAENMGKPRMLAVSPNGDVYVSDREKGTVSLLRYAQGTGKSAAAVEVARAPDLHGLAIMDGRLYIAAIRELYVADIRSDGTLGELNGTVRSLRAIR